jgi:hypothetical protein
MNAQQVWEKLSIIPQTILDTLKLEVHLDKRKDLDIIIQAPIWFNLPITDKLEVDETDFVFHINTDKAKLTIWKNHPEKLNFCIY